MAWFAERGHKVTGEDRSAESLAGLPADFETIEADIEDAPWPLEGRGFDAVVVTNYPKDIKASSYSNRKGAC